MDRSTAKQLLAFTALITLIFVGASVLERLTGWPLLSGTPDTPQLTVGIDYTAVPDPEAGAMVYVLSADPANPLRDGRERSYAWHTNVSLVPLEAFATTPTADLHLSCAQIARLDVALVGLEVYDTDANGQVVASGEHSVELPRCPDAPAVDQDEARLRSAASSAAPSRVRSSR